MNLIKVGDGRHRTPPNGVRRRKWKAGHPLTFKFGIWSQERGI